MKASIMGEIAITTKEPIEYILLGVDALFFTVGVTRFHFE